MATEAKPFASLSSGLLARKGAARPAMRPQGFGQAGAGLEDLGWNDMGFEPPKPAVTPLRDVDHDAFGDETDGEPRLHPTGLTPVQSPVHSQHAEIADRFGAADAGEEFDETAEMFEPEAAEEQEPVFAAPAEPIATVAFAEPVAVAAAPAELEVAVAAPVEPPARARFVKPRAAPGSKSKAAFTLRLDPKRHLKLRLACAVNGRSAQQLVTDALDVLLGDMPELEAMAEKANRKG